MFSAYLVYKVCLQSIYFFAEMSWQKSTSELRTCDDNIKMALKDL
jgi:hypothetical protein